MPVPESRFFSAKRIGLGVGALVLWVLIYMQLEWFAHFVSFRLLAFPEGSHLGESIAFFLYDTPKVLLLLTLVVFAIGVVRSFFTPESTRKILTGKKESAGNVLAALLGIVTPFCSCSAVPLFVGFVSAGVPLGVTFSFLISAPMINEIALVLLYGLFGWKVAALYLSTGLLIAMIAGWIIGRLRMEGHLEDWVREIRAVDAGYEEPKKTWAERIQYGLDAVRDIVGKVWKYVILGIAVGAAIHGYVPEGFMASIMGKGSWWAVPASVLIGNSHVFECRRDYSHCSGPARKGCRAGDGARFHDVGDSSVAPGSHYPAQSAQAHAHCDLLRRCGSRHSCRRLPF